MRNSHGVLLCVACFVSGLVVRCVVSVNQYCETELVHTLVCCILEVRCSQAGVVSGLQAQAQLVFSRGMRGLIIGIVMVETC